MTARNGSRKGSRGESRLATRATGSRAAAYLSNKSDPWTDLALTLPVFVGYHLGVAFLPIRNAADFVTSNLVQLASYSMFAYAGLTLLIAGGFVGVLVFEGRGQTLNWQRFAAVMVEGAICAIAMALVARSVVGALHLVAGKPMSVFSGLVMSFGAGFYEEIVFRVGLFGVGLALLNRYVNYAKVHPIMVGLGWALVTSLVFSLWHYVGPYGDSFAWASLVFRWVCGMCFAAIYHYRGFAPVVWCHTLYDVWVLVL